MAMSRADYVAIAAIMKKARSNARTHREHTMAVWIAREIAMHCKAANKDFDLQRFLDASDAMHFDEGFNLTR